MTSYIEPGSLADGTHCWRWVCHQCSPVRYGIWLTELEYVERNRRIHQQALHAQRASA